MDILFLLKERLFRTYPVSYYGWLDASFEYIYMPSSFRLEGLYNKSQGHRKIFIPSVVPFINPIQTTIRHKNHSNTYAAHILASYDIPLGENFQIWPFLNEDFIIVV